MKLTITHLIIISIMSTLKDLAKRNNLLLELKYNNQVKLDFRKWKIEVTYHDGVVSNPTNLSTYRMEVLSAHYLRDKRVKKMHVFELKEK